MIWLYCIADNNYRYIILAIMKYHITLTRNDVIGELACSRSPAPLTILMNHIQQFLKKRTSMPSICMLLISVLLLGSNDTI